MSHWQLWARVFVAVMVIGTCVYIWGLNHLHPPPEVRIRGGLPYQEVTDQDEAGST